MKIKYFKKSKLIFNTKPMSEYYQLLQCYNTHYFSNLFKILTARSNPCDILHYKMFWR